MFLECAKITSSCDKWEGIIVEGNSNTHQYELNGQRQQGYLRIKNSTIENAEFAVRTYVADQSDPDFQNGRGGIVIASDSDFRNNLESISIVDYQNFNFVTGQPIANFSNFTNCTFEIDDDYIGNYLSDFRNHVFLQRVTGINFNGCEFYNSHSAATFAHERRVGIQSQDANFLVGSSCLDTGITSLPCENQKPSHFEGMGYGINAHNKGSANTFRVVRAEFIDNFVGISANSVNNIYAVKNKFEVGMPLPPQFAQTHYAGIQLYGATGYQVEANEFTASDQAPANAITIGSAVSGSWEEANEIYRNTYDNLMYGNLSNGDNRNSIPEIGLQYQCNENAANNYDFGVHEEASIAFNQGSAQRSAKNCFSNNPDVDFSDFFNQAASINYFHDDICNPLDVSLNVNKFFGEENTCPSGIPGDDKGKLSEIEKTNLEIDLEQTPELPEQTKIINKLLRDYMIDEDNYDWEKVRERLLAKGGIKSRFMIVDSWLYEKDAPNAQQALDEIPYEFNFSAKDVEKYQYFKSLKDLQISALNNQIADDDMTQLNFAVISDIAGKGDLYAARQAQEFINAVQEYTYVPVLLIPGQSSQQLVSPNAGVINTAEAGATFLLKVAPNPANDFAKFTYQLPDDAEQGTIEIRNIQGQLLASIPINSNIGKVNWNNDKLTNGVYLYSLVVKNKVISNQRLVITK